MLSDLTLRIALDAIVYQLDDLDEEIGDLECEIDEIRTEWDYGNEGPYDQQRINEAEAEIALLESQRSLLYLAMNELRAEEKEIRNVH